ncbi:MAG: vWA domain-containing protein, partial [Ardenticatenales bacterium]
SGFAAFGLASSDEDALRTTDGVQRRMVRYHVPDAMATDVTLTDILPANMVVDAASIGSTGQWRSPNVVWTASNVGYDGLQANVALQPTTGGTWPVSDGTTAQLTDGWGTTQTVTFPIPTVEVIGPTPTAVPPTATPVPATATATARPPRSLFLPVAFVGRCKMEPVALDIALVIDISSSMAAPDASADPNAIAAGSSKLRTAQNAAEAIVRALRDGDRVFVTAFDAEVHRTADWTADRASAVAAIESLSTGHGSRIDLGLDAGRAAFEAAGAGTSRALVVLTDGVASGTTRDAVLAAAEATRATGADLFVFGVGTDGDPVLLQAIADGPDRVRQAGRDEATSFLEGLFARTQTVCD